MESATRQATCNGLDTLDNEMKQASVGFESLLSQGGAATAIMMGITTEETQGRQWIRCSTSSDAVSSGSEEPHQYSILRRSGRIKNASGLVLLPLLITVLFQPVSSAFVGPAVTSHSRHHPRWISSSTTRIHQSAYRHPFDDEDGHYTQPFFAAKQQSNQTTTTDLLSPEVRAWTDLMSSTSTEQDQHEGLWEAYSRRMANRGENQHEQQQSSPPTSHHNNGTDTSSSMQATSTATVTATAEEETSPLTQDDEAQIAAFWDELEPTIQYLPSQRHEEVYQALRVAYECHHGQMRKSGEPFIVHPVQVALLLTSLKMDTETIMAGLLHDTVEDTEMTFERVEQLFGPVVKSIVEGETKVSKLPKLAFSTTTSTAAPDDGQPVDVAAEQDANNYDEQAENLRQMFVAMTEDYRIIIVKLADRLHNMRTLQHMKPAKQIKISRETLDIFAPLAHRMGIWQFKSELEDISFRYLYPQEHKRLNRKLQSHEQRLSHVLERSQHLLKEQLQTDPTLREQTASVEVVGRTKEIYSLWHKMETKEERNLDHIGDVVALRVIITPKEAQQEEMFYSDDEEEEDEEEDDDDEEEYYYEEDEDLYYDEDEVEEEDHDFKSSQSFTKEQNVRPAQSTTNQADRGVWLCYHVLGLVQHLPGFQPVPTRVKDYISFPKPNGYQSLHTAVMLQGQTIEVQIRTSTMHQVAEYGMASHWAYTDSKRMPHADVYNTPWLSSIKEWQKDRISSRDFVESVRRELLGKRVFVFLRNGKILNLARGATAIDAAFQIHTEVGLEMHGVEINGKPVPFSYELRNGDVVSILTGKGRPSLDWMRYAKSRSTRSKLRSYFRQKQKESLREAGKILLMDYLWMHGPTIEQHRPLVRVPTTVEDVAEVLEERLHEQEDAQNIPQFDNIDDLLVALGKQHDRDMLHKIVARLFGVPAIALAQAEKCKNRGLLVPGSVVDAIKQSRRNAKYAAKAVQHNGEQSPRTKDEQKEPPKWPVSLPTQTRTASMLDSLFETLKGQTEYYADPEHLCRHCLPVYGDEIVGTRPSCSTDLSPPPKDDDLMDAITMVHRIGCPVAQRAINLASASAILSKHTVDSVSLRRMANKRNGQSSNSALLSDDVPVKLTWSEYDNGEDGCVFMTEVVVVAEDRKLLLADCSEVVSEMSEIVRTGSSSSQEHATLVFLVQIEGLHQLQQLMDGLQQIRSVMSVERRFGSELLN
ncbi:ppGpp synthase/hydrolase RelA [Seminavis robusta]|uniref:Putative GTP diphosphokinase RSH1, chloroplastic n=1 Tax=Seminavis robusta TaxID=568900 RepID=A0A9N8EHK4_9STRA|nr:ppGpp synthase/hydrolase RelA [Seminavis robusta]|eukprot:Sro1222_g253810.1 ppGpp synthase/hydrolase RelA (1211) ;mRNA; r:18162-21971